MNMTAQLPNRLVKLQLTIGQDRINTFAALAGDHNPIHIDAEAARQSGMSNIIAHGSISLNLLWESIEKSTRDVASSSLNLEVRFRAPVYVDEIVETGGSQVGDSNNYEVWVSNQEGSRVIEGTLTIES